MAAAWGPGTSAAADGDHPVGALIAARTADAQDLLVARGRSIGPDSPAEDLHELRKDAKKLRYRLECSGSLYGPTRRKAFVQLLKRLQDKLGEHQDTEAHVAELRSVPGQLTARAAVEPATLVAVGQITEQLDHRRRAARAEFRRPLLHLRHQGHATQPPEAAADVRRPPVTGL